MTDHRVVARDTYTFAKLTASDEANQSSERFENDDGSVTPVEHEHEVL